MKCHYYIFAFLFVILLSVLTVKPIEASTWGTFKIAHVLDPDTEEDRYYNWNREEWVTWLHSRDELDLYERGGKRNPKHSMMSKGINSVIIASPVDILDAFNETSVLLKDDNKGKLYWSDSKFLIYTFKKLNRGTYEVYRCDNLYFVAGLDSDKRPVHFAGCGPSVIANYIGNLRFPWDSCRKINGFGT